MNNKGLRAGRNLLNWQKNLKKRLNKEKQDKMRLKKSMKKRKDSKN